MRVGIGDAMRQYSDPAAAAEDAVMLMCLFIMHKEPNWQTGVVIDPPSSGV